MRKIEATIAVLGFRLNTFGFARGPTTRFNYSRATVIDMASFMAFIVADTAPR
jgi:hypothetical protein